MSLEDSYDAWVRGLMGGGKYAATPRQTAEASEAVQQMQAQLAALTAAQKRQNAAERVLAGVQKAGAATAESVRKMSSDLTKSLKQDGLLGGTVAAPAPAPAAPVKADFSGVTDTIRAQVLGQDAFVSALVKAFRSPFVLGTAQEADRARSVMLLCGPNGTGRHYALQCVVDELAARGVLHSAAVETLDLALYPGPAQEKLFLQDLFAALQSDAEVLPEGTGYLTDLGMTGPANAVLGIAPEQSIGKFLGDPPRRYEAAMGAAKLEGAIFEVDSDTGRCRDVHLVRLR